MNANLNRIQRYRRPGRCRAPLAVVLALSGAACSDPVPIAGPDGLPQTLPSSPSAASWVVRGTVVEHTMSETRPFPGVRLRVFASVDRNTVVVDATSGADGTYSAGVPESAHFVWVRPLSTSHYAPCPPFAFGGQRVEPLDVHAVSGAILSTTGIPPSFADFTSSRQNFSAFISGRVFERTSGGIEPVSGASVVMSPGEDAVYTLSDADGRYLLCSVGNPEIAVVVEARMEGYVPASSYGIPWFGWDLDFELARR